jgi:small conductance mechanosensitive channel
MNDFWQSLAPILEDYANRGLRALLILAAGWLAIHFLVAPLRRVLERNRFDPSVASFLANSARTILLVAVILAILNQFGVETTSLLTLLGAVALAVALSLQSSLANFASGLVVLSFRLVRVGEWIETGDIRGRVEELLPFHVVLITADNQRVTLPNTTLTSSAIRNLSALPTRRLEWSLPVDAKENLQLVKETLISCLRADNRVLTEPPPEVFVKEWAADKRVLTILAWVRRADYTALQQEMLEKLGASLEGLGNTGSADEKR